nr:MAG TPA: hypothetical protein [Caudoviricetes sp.]
MFLNMFFYNIYSVTRATEGNFNCHMLFFCQLLHC